MIASTTAPSFKVQLQYFFPDHENFLDFWSFEWFSSRGWADSLFFSWDKGIKENKWETYKV